MAAKCSPTAWSLAAGLVLAAFAPGCATKSATPPAKPQAAARTPPPVPEGRDPRWARPMERPGLPNLHWVSGDLYRGAQPSAEGFGELKALGVKTVVNLRLLHSDRDEMRKAGLSARARAEPDVPAGLSQVGDPPAGGDFNYVHIKMEAWDGDEDEVVDFLRVLADPARRPVFVHCKHGADRTGTMCAIYRVVVQGWSKEDAVDEMRKGGYGFHAIWRELPKFVRDLDVDGMKRAAGMAQ